jgi:hypothetical protein
MCSPLSRIKGELIATLGMTHHVSFLNTKKAWPVDRYGLVSRQIDAVNISPIAVKRSLKISWSKCWRGGNRNALGMVLILVH